MNETSPSPPTSGQSCPKCGAAQAASADVCTDCGASLQFTKPRHLPGWLKIMLSVVLSLAAMGCVLLGGLVAFLGLVIAPTEAFGMGTYSPSDHQKTINLLLFLGVTAIVCIVGLWKLNKKS